MMLKERYIKKVIPQMIKKFNYKSPMAVPRIEKVVINTGIGKILGNIDPSKRQELTEIISTDLSLITGQKPILTKAKKAISGFKIRKGTMVGLKVTLRGNRMYEFLDRLLNLVLPRSRDFKGIPLSSFNREGNLTMGIREHIIFPEVPLERIKIIFGLEVNINIRAKNKEEAIELCRLLGFPIKIRSEYK